MPDPTKPSPDPLAAFQTAMGEGDKSEPRRPSPIGLIPISPETFSGLLTGLVGASMSPPSSCEATSAGENSPPDAASVPDFGGAVAYLPQAIRRMVRLGRRGGTMPRKTAEGLTHLAAAIESLPPGWLPVTLGQMFIIHQTREGMCFDMHAAPWMMGHAGTLAKALGAMKQLAAEQDRKDGRRKKS